MKNGKRRGATKVPNVILRPPPPVSNSKKVVGTSSEQGDNNGPVEFDFGANALPLRGVNLCASGKLDKVTLFHHAQQLGATRSNDFTDQVTHLVADAPGSAKYKCAVERNLPILRESWIEDIYQSWLDGETIDLDQFVAKHRLPIFTGVRLCITGLRDIEIREQIAIILQEQEGTCSGSLDLSSTHLLCSESTSNKIAWAKRVNKEQGRKKIHVIWEEWFWDCLEFNGRWDEELYDIDMPRPARKVVTESLEKLNKEVTILPSATLSQLGSLPRSLSTSSLTVDDDAPELGQTQKQKGVGLRILRNIVHTRNFFQNGEETQTVGDSSLGPSIDASALVKTNAAMPFGLQQGTSSVLNRLSDSRTTSFAAGPPPLAITRHVSGASSSVLPPESTPSIPISDTRVSNIFSGYSFRALGEAKEGAMLRDAINKHGGRWLNDDDTLVEPDFFLVRLAGGNNFWDKANSGDRSKYRTECWVERSILEERICAADEHITFRPLNITIPVAGSEKLYVSLSGLDSAETYWTKRLLRAVGANVQSVFSKSSSHLICPSGRGEKFQKAREWKIPVVNLEWLFFIAMNGKIPSPQDFEVGSDGAKGTVHESRNALPNSTTEDNGKEVLGREGKIVDITNSHLQEIQPLGPPDPSLHLEETTSVTGHLTARHDSISTSVNSTSSFPSIKIDGDMVLTFGEPLGLRIPGSPPIEKDNVRGSSLQSSHLSLPQEELKMHLDVDVQPVQIPSSCSPSPLKTVNTDSKRTLSRSLSETRGLRTAITALLGKRELESKPDELTTQKRPTKRPRPHLRSLKESDTPMPSLTSLVAASSPFLCLSPEEENIANEEGSGLRVIYEDPDQRDEKRRLIALFEKDSTVHGSADEVTLTRSNVKHLNEIPETSKRKKSTRRSNRSKG